MSENIVNSSSMSIRVSSWTYSERRAVQTLYAEVSLSNCHVPSSTHAPVSSPTLRPERLVNSQPQIDSMADAQFDSAL